MFKNLAMTCLALGAALLLVSPVSAQSTMIRGK